MNNQEESDIPNLHNAKPSIHANQLGRRNSSEAAPLIELTGQGQPQIPGGITRPNVPQQVVIQGAHTNPQYQMIQPNMITLSPGHPGQMNMGPPRQPPPGAGFSNHPTGPGGYSGGAPIHRAVSRFDGDNKGLQGLHQPTQPSGYENYQVCSSKCSGWFGTYLPCLFCCSNPYKRVPEGYAGVIVRFGKFYKLVGPGMHYLLPDLDILSLVDKREKVVQLKSQNLVTIDNATLLIDAVLYYKISNSYKSKFAAVNLDLSIQDLSITVLRNVVGKMTVQQFLQMQDHLAEQIETEIAHIADTWGVKVTRLLVQDVSLPPQFRNSFSTGAVAKKISEAQVIHSQAEVQVAKLLKEASDSLNTDAAFQIRYIDALENIAKSENPKMIFFPADYRDVGSANSDIA